MKRKATWIGRKGIDSKGQNQRILWRENCFRKWLGTSCEE